jgi:hypothetical protein
MRGHEDTRARALVAEEAARLMYEERVEQYFTAKRMAAKRLFGHGNARTRTFRASDLPSNGEIQAAMLAYAESVEGDTRTERLHRMRTLALVAMRMLEAFEPRLVGSVATGHVHVGSDIDIQLFTDDTDAPERFFRARRLPYERDDVLIRRGNRWCEYQHIRLDADFPIELTVYPRRELRVRSRSSTDGKPMTRLRIDHVEALLAERG